VPAHPIRRATHCALLALALLLALNASARGQAAAPEEPALVLHQGATVRVRVPQLGPDWIAGRVVQTAGAHPCLSFKLERTDAGGRAQYVFLSGVREVEVDRRTNEGALTFGLPPTTADDWEPVALAALRRQDAGCRRR
jgi:hypothetical protein